MKRVAFFFVNYNNSNKSIDCIQSLINQSANNYLSNIYIIDNDSVDAEKNILKEYILHTSASNISIEGIFLEDNIGYFPALNKSYLMKKDIVAQSDYVIIGNNDLMFNANFLADLQTKNYSSDIYVISPDIVNSDDNHQNPQIIKKYTQLQLIHLELYHSSYFMACLLGIVSRFIKYRGSQKSKDGYNKSQYISIGYGACYILTRNYLSNVGRIPSYLFLMNEENALTDIILKNNGRIFYDSTLTVNHLEHSAISLAPKRGMYKIVQESYKISKKHFNNKHLFDKQIN